jgi:hypothetical protein
MIKKELLGADILKLPSALVVVACEEFLMLIVAPFTGLLLSAVTNPVTVLF